MGKNLPSRLSPSINLPKNRGTVDTAADTVADMVDVAMVAPSPMKPKSWKDKSRGTVDTAADTVVDMAVAAMVAPSLMRPKSWKDKSRGTADTVDTEVGTVDAAMVVPLPSKYLDKLNLLNDSLRQCILITYVISSFRH